MLPPLKTCANGDFFFRNAPTAIEYRLKLSRLKFRTYASAGELRRPFGDRTAQGRDCMICQFCRNYLLVDAHDFKYGWCSFFYTVLCDQSTLDVQLIQTVSAILPTSVRDLFKHIRTNRTAYTCLLLEPKCIDITSAKRSFMQLIKSYRLKNLRKALNTEPFPRIRCPVGCFMFIDEAVDGVSFVHYVNLKCPNFLYFKANSKYILACQPSWPLSRNYLDWIISGGLYFDNADGWLIACCGSHPMDSYIISPPEHPLLVTRGFWGGKGQDNLAPVIASANVLSRGVSRSNNDSYTIYKQFGNHSGAATFHLTERPKSRYLDEGESLKLALVGVYRADKKNIFCNEDIVSAECITSCYTNSYLKPNPLFNITLVNELMNGSSYLPIVQCSQLAANYNAIGETRNMNKVKDVNITPLTRHGGRLSVPSFSALEKMPKTIMFGVFSLLIIVIPTQHSFAEINS